MLCRACFVQVTNTGFPAACSAAGDAASNVGGLHLLRQLLCSSAASLTAGLH